MIIKHGNKRISADKIVYYELITEDIVCDMTGQLTAENKHLVGKTRVYLGGSLSEVLDVSPELLDEVMADANTACVVELRREAR